MGSLGIGLVAGGLGGALGLGGGFLVVPALGSLILPLQGTGQARENRDKSGKKMKSLKRCVFLISTYFRLNNSFVFFSGEQ